MPGSGRHLYADVRRQRQPVPGPFGADAERTRLRLRGQDVRAGPSAAGQLWPRTHPAASRRAEPIPASDRSWWSIPRGPRPRHWRFQTRERGRRGPTGWPSLLLRWLFCPIPFPARPSKTSCAPKRPSCARSASCTRQRGKPAVIGNLPGGWQILMTAAVWPELFGPIIVAGAPLSYWAGDNLMRYAGGLTGGSWLTVLTGDLGGPVRRRLAGTELREPGPGQYAVEQTANLLRHCCRHGRPAPLRAIPEKYWGGHVFLNDVEIQYIVDNLFIGNKLSMAQLVTSDGVRIDLRNIARRSWCSAPMGTTSRHRPRPWAGSPTCPQRPGRAGT